MEVHVWNARRPVCVDVGHVHPWDESSGEGVEQTFFWQVDFSDTENIVDIADHSEAGGWYEVGRRVSQCGVAGVRVESLDHLSAIARCQTVLLDWHENIKITFDSCVVWKDEILGSTCCRHGATSTRLSISAGAWSWLEVHGNLSVALLDNEDFGCKVSGLILLISW